MLSETAEQYKNSFALTPATSITAEKDWKNRDVQSFWYNCKNYRVNLYKENGFFWIRDLFLFDENYSERYREEVCRSKDVYFDNLPVIDGNRQSGKGVRAGIYPEIKQSDNKYVPLKGSAKAEYDYPEEKITVKDSDTEFIIGISEDSLCIKCSKDFKLCFRTSPDVERFTLSNGRLYRTYNGYEYSFTLSDGAFSEETNEIYPENRTIVLNFSASDFERYYNITSNLKSSKPHVDKEKFKN